MCRNGIRMWYCVLSSCIFLTNATIAYIHSRYVYGMLWVWLFFTSIIYHTARIYHNDTIVFTETSINNNINNPFIQSARYTDGFVSILLLSVFLYSQSYKLMNRKWNMPVISLNIVIFVLLVYSAFIFWYGEQFNKYCFHTYRLIAEKWHSTIHLSVSIGDHLSYLV